MRCVPMFSGVAEHVLKKASFVLNLTLYQSHLEGDNKFFYRVKRCSFIQEKKTKKLRNKKLFQPQDKYLTYLFH